MHWTITLPLAYCLGAYIAIDNLWGRAKQKLRPGRTQREQAAREARAGPAVIRSTYELRPSSFQMPQEAVNSAKHVNEWERVDSSA